MRSSSFLSCWVLLRGDYRPGPLGRSRLRRLSTLLLPRQKRMKVAELHSVSRAPVDEVTPQLSRSEPPANRLLVDACDCRNFYNGEPLLVTHRATSRSTLTSSLAPKRDMAIRNALFEANGISDDASLPATVSTWQDTSCPFNGRQLKHLFSTHPPNNPSRRPYGRPSLQGSEHETGGEASPIGSGIPEGAGLRTR